MSDFAFSKRTPCDQSGTVSGFGHRVLASRCFRSSISESAIATVNGRTRADDAGVVAVIALSPEVSLLRCQLTVGGPVGTSTPDAVTIGTTTSRSEHHGDS